MDRPVQRVQAAPSAVSVPAAPPAAPISRPNTLLAGDDAPDGDPNNVAIKDEQGKSVKPSAVLFSDNDILFLAPECLWVCANGQAQLGTAGVLVVKRINLPKSFNGLRLQELNNFAVCSARHSIIVLDKSGDLYEYSPGSKKWQLFRANLPFTKGQPDPEFIDLSVIGDMVALLDPERNQIWKTWGGVAHMDGYLKDALPWKLQPGDPRVSDGISLAFDGYCYVLTRHGYITKFNTTSNSHAANQLPMRYKRLPGMRPARLITAAGTPLYIVERENNRVCAVDKNSGHISQFCFSAGSDLRGLVPQDDGFWIINKGRLCWRKLSSADHKTQVHRHGIDQRVEGLIIPIAGVRLPRHVGVFPGARRLYRFGVHEGLDIFYDPGSKLKVAMGTPVRAADSGKVARADEQFEDMSAAQFSRVMNQCYKEHRTSAHNEDLFRGCQVWLSHGNGLMTRYAHLSKINPGLRKDRLVARGDLIGFVGVSGTGQNLPGRVKYPHLHFEIWLDGKYLGWGLTPAETMAVYENIFGE